MFGSPVSHIDVSLNVHSDITGGVQCYSFILASRHLHEKIPLRIKFLHKLVFFVTNIDIASLIKR